MQRNLEKYKKDLKSLSDIGNSLHMALQFQCYPDEFKKEVEKKLEKIKAKKYLKELPDFSSEYQQWYSEAKAIIKQLLPDRLDDFVRHYEKPKPRKDITFENYRIEDGLQGLNITKGWENKKVVGPCAAIPHLVQQLAILKSVSARFESSLFDIQQLVQADILDSELDSAGELLKHGFVRAAGAIAGVVLEKHLSQVTKNHNITTRKKNPSISDFNDLLKKENVIDTPLWRNIQRLGDIRNLCDHNKERDPTDDDAQELINGVEKITKTLF